MQLSSPIREKDLVKQLASAVEELVEFYQTRDRSAVCYHDISVSECRALAVIAKRGPLRLNAVAGALHLDKSTTSRVVESLVKKGYVHCQQDREDGRGLRISAATSGKKLYKRIRLNLLSEYAAILDEYPDSFKCLIPGFLKKITLAATCRMEKKNDSKRTS